MSPHANHLAQEPGESSSPIPGVYSFGSSNEGLARAAATSSSELVQKEAFDELFRRMWRTTVEWASAVGAMTQHLAEDAATQAWFKAWRYRQSYDPTKGRYGTWLGAIVRNETFDLVKSQKKEVPTTAISADTFAADRAAVAELELEALDFVFDAFEALLRDKPQFAKVLALKAQGYREKQICQMLDIPTPGTVGSRLSRSKQFIASWLAELGVVFLAEGAVGTVHPLGLVPLCRTGDGSFYSFSPIDGLFALPGGESPPPGSTPICEGFFVKVWSYPTDRFEVRIGSEESVERAIFSWKQYAVYAKDV